MSPIPLLRRPPPAALPPFSVLGFCPHFGRWDQVGRLKACPARCARILVDVIRLAG